MPINSCFLKFMSYNVEGLSPMLSDNSFIEKITKYDFISLIETWLPEGFNINIPGFYSMSKYRKKAKKARRHSGGITVLVKNSLRKGVKFFSSKSDRFLWWKLDKAFFNLNDDIYICTVYIPPSNSSHHNQILEYPFDELQYAIMKYSAKGKIVLNGDFNARKGSLIDFIQYEDSTFLDTSYMENQQYSVHSFSLPNNMDKTTNKYGRPLNEICISNDLYFLNGRIRGDNSGKFTCHKFNEASVVDYAIVSSCLLDKIIYFSVHSLDYYSCHCPISFCLKTRPFDRSMNDSNESFKLLPMPDSFQWENNANVVHQKLLSDHSQSSELTNCAKNLDNSPVMIDHTVEVFTKEIKNIAAKCLNLRKSTKKPKDPLNLIINNGTTEIVRHPKSF